MTLDQAKLVIAAGGQLTDIGQLDDSTKKWLRAEIKAGRILKFTTRKFPEPKTAYTASFTGLAS